MSRCILTAAVALALLAPTARAGSDDDFLTVGDKAPKIDIAHWLKGGQIDEFEDDKVYVLEFWATWCGPCVASMPHLSKLQDDYKDYDVKIISVSDEPLQTVVEFLFKEYRDGKIHNERTAYTVTTDPDESVKKAYFKAAGRGGIPSAFIIGRDQRIEWIGHPMNMDAPLEAVVKNDWDRKAFKKQFEEEQAGEREMIKLQEQFMKAHGDGKWEKALEKLDKMIEISPGNPAFTMKKIEILAKDMKKYDKAWAVAGEVIEQSWDDAQMLNNVAWFIADDKDLEERDLKLAKKAAMRANKLTDGKDGPILDTVARIFFEMGDLQSALEYQREAIKYSEGRMAEQLKATLEKYERLAEKDL